MLLRYRPFLPAQLLSILLFDGDSDESASNTEGVITWPANPVEVLQGPVALLSFEIETEGGVARITGRHQDQAGQACGE
jgi:hypothetical protein